MTGRALWRVWSYDEANDGWVAVDQGSESDVRAGAERRNAAAERHGSGGAYVALPDGEVPVGPPAPDPEPPPPAGTSARAVLAAALAALDGVALAANELDPSPWRLAGVPQDGVAGTTRVRDSAGHMVVRDGTDAAHAHIAANHPAAVLSRNAAVRALLERHAACPDDCGTTNLLADAFAPGWRDRA